MARSVARWCYATAETAGAALPDPAARDRSAARAAVRGVLHELIASYLEPVERPEELLAAEPLRLVIEP